MIIVIPVVIISLWAWQVAFVLQSIQNNAESLSILLDPCKTPLNPRNCAKRRVLFALLTSYTHPHPHRHRHHHHKATIGPDMGGIYIYSYIAIIMTNNAKFVLVVWHIIEQQSGEIKQKPAAKLKCFPLFVKRGLYAFAICSVVRLLSTL